MKNLLMMLSVLTLLGCKAFDPTASADLGAPAAAKAIPSSDATTSNEVIALTNPLDVSGGEVEEALTAMARCGRSVLSKVRRDRKITA